MPKVSMAELGDDFNLSVPGLDEAYLHRSQARLTEIAPNPLNPRSDLGDLTELADSLSSQGQLQSITVVTRDSYLAHYPEHADSIGQAPYVAITGARRHAAAAKAGLTVLDITVRQEVASSRETLATAAITENIERADLSVLEEAEAVDRLVELCGSQRKAAQRLHRTQGWISQRLALLKLSPRMRKELSAGRLRVEDARRVAKLPTDEQYDRWQEELAAAAEGDYGVITSGPDAEASTTPEPDDEPDVDSRGSNDRPAPQRFDEFEAKLAEKFDTRARVELGRSKGRITLEFGNVDDLERIMTLLEFDG